MADPVTGTEPESGSGTASGTEPESGSRSASGTGAASGSGSEPESASGTGTASASGSRSASGAGTTSGSGSEPESGSRSASGTGAGSGTASRAVSAQAPVAVRHVEEAMGTVFSFDVRGGKPAAVRAALAEAVAGLHRADEVFSTYRDGSEISRLARGELTVEACAPEVAEVLELAAEAERVSDGWFSTRYGGRLDPTGIVKGWAVERAARRISAVVAGASGVSVNGGGDVQLLGTPGAARPWRVGVSDPLRPGGLAAVVSAAGAAELAVATSGSAERGAHVVDPRTGRSAVTDLLSVTVVAPRLTWADCWATAAFAMGARDGLRWLESLPGVEGLLITAGDEVRCTGGLAAWLG
ncbi:FAD:protein FMN transferase [Streptomyces sp. V17-9]|nr:FAD:protein FMN transferase [Streptomyces sp. V17-9]